MCCVPTEPPSRPSRGRGWSHHPPSGHAIADGIAEFDETRNQAHRLRVPIEVRSARARQTRSAMPWEHSNPIVRCQPLATPGHGKRFSDGSCGRSRAERPHGAARLEPRSGCLSRPGSGRRRAMHRSGAETAEMDASSSSLCFRARRRSIRTARARGRSGASKRDATRGARRLPGCRLVAHGRRHGDRGSAHRAGCAGSGWKDAHSLQPDASVLRIDAV